MDKYVHVWIDKYVHLADGQICPSFLLLLILFQSIF